MKIFTDFEYYFVYKKYVHKIAFSKKHKMTCLFSIISRKMSSKGILQLFGFFSMIVLCLEMFNRIQVQFIILL